MSLLQRVQCVDGRCELRLQLVAHRVRLLGDDLHASRARHGAFVLSGGSCGGRDRQRGRWKGRWKQWTGMNEPIEGAVKGVVDDAVEGAEEGPVEGAHLGAL